jgi:hypothetical protein
LLDVNNISSSILVVVEKLLPSPIDFIGTDVNNIRGNSLVGAELKAFLSVCDSSDKRSSNRFSLEDDLKLREGLWIWNKTKLNEDTVSSQE